MRANQLALSGFAVLIGVLRVAGSSQKPIINNADRLIVSLADYGSFEGIHLYETLTGKELPTPVDAWLGIDYAIQPVGRRRFAPVEGYPLTFDGVRSAQVYGNICIQTGIPALTQDEACLNLNVFRPTNVPLSQKLPAMIWIHGGGFVEGSARTLDGAAFVASSKAPISVVTFNYRLNSLGFLPSKLFAVKGLLNLGLRDQKYMLEFLQKHASSLGIDNDQITLGGRSAGGHSAAFHYFHNYGKDASNPLFARAIFQSGASTARAFPPADYDLNQDHYNRVMQHLDCPTDDDDASLDCLRTADINKIQAISTALWDESQYFLNWPFQPCQGGPLLEKPGSISGAEGTFHHLPVITSGVTDEGKFYTPGDLETPADFVEYIHTFSPELNYTDIALLHSLYPDPTTNPSCLYSDSPNSTQYNRISAAWSDYAYICPSRHTAETTSLAGVPTWKLRFNTPDHPLDKQAWRGIPHTSDVAYTFDCPDVPYVDTAHIYHAYLASFVASGNPNTYRWPGSPEWPTYEVENEEMPVQLVVHPGNNTLVEKDAIRVAQCRFWNDLDRAERLHK